MRKIPAAIIFTKKHPKNPCQSHEYILKWFQSGGKWSEVVKSGGNSSQFPKICASGGRNYGEAADGFHFERQVIVHVYG